MVPGRLVIIGMHGSGPPSDNRDASIDKSGLF